MRNAKAKKIRKLVYMDFSPRFRQYRMDSRGIVQADERRQQYQKMKKIFR